MLLAYVDESGDSGYSASPSGAFVLSVVILHSSQWMEALDRMVDMRRYFASAYGISPRVELKANYLIHRKGPFKALTHLDLDARLRVYRQVMEAQCKLGFFKTWAVHIDKTRIKQQGRDPRDFAWSFMIERLDNYAKREGESIMLYPDAGHGYFIRRLVRRMRRFHRVPSAFNPSSHLPGDATRIVEDPSDRASDESYFVQLADLNAYAAARYVAPDSRMGEEMWEELGDSRLTAVNSLRGGPPAIKAFPPPGR